MSYRNRAVSLCVLGFTLGVGNAQSAGAAQDTSSAAADQPAATTITQELTEVIVTASRREQSVQASSLAIEVLDGDSIVNSGITRVADLQNAVPSLSTASSGQNISTYIRGVGSFSTDANADSSIAYNIDGVFISRPAGVGAVFFDLDRVEILKGPQGTLYGRNASGGAINLITKRPTRDFEASASLDVGNYDLARLEGAVSGPLSDTLAVRMAGQYANHDGYLSDGYNDQDDISARASVLWEPSSAASLLVVGEYVELDGKGSAGAFRSSIQAQPSDPWTGPTEAPPPAAAIIGPDDITRNGFVDTRIKAISAQLDVDLDFATLTFIPAYRDTEPSTLTYQPGFYFNTAEAAEQQSYELRLANDGDRLKWVVGAYYFDEDQTQDYTLLARPIQQNRVITQLSTEAYALFGEATYGVTDALRFIGGLRYSEDKKGQNGTSSASLPFPTTVNNYGRRTDDNVSFRAGVEYDIGTSNMLFTTVATGYKAGGFFPSVLAPNNTFEPETITAYTIGSRNRFAENRVQVNAEAFYWDYEDKQERFLGVLPSGGTGLLTTNAGSATVYGANLDIVARVGAGTLRLNGEYLHTNYDSFSYTAVSAGPGAAFGYSPLATSCAIGPRVPINPAVATNLIDCSDKPLPHAPSWTGSLSYAHPFQLANGDQIIPGAAAKSASSMFLSPDFIASAEDDGYVVFDANLTYESQRGFSVTAWVRNIGDEEIYSGGYRYPFSLPLQFGGDPTLFYADIRPPRTYGVTLRASFR